MMDWEKQIVRRTLEGAGEHPAAQLQFLLQRLEACPEALPAIVNAIEDMADFQERQAKTLRAEKAGREARERLAEIIELQK